MRLWMRVLERVESLIIANEPWSGRFIGGAEIHQMLGMADVLKVMSDPMEVYADRLIHDCQMLAIDWRRGLT